MAPLAPTAPTSWWSRGRSDRAYPAAPDRTADTRRRREPCDAGTTPPGRTAIGPASSRPSDDPARPNGAAEHGSTGDARSQSDAGSATDHRVDADGSSNGELDHEERRIAAALVAGDPDALADAFARWGEMIHALCTRWAYVDAADDLTQQVIVSAWGSRSSFDPSRGVLPAWLVGIARNTTNRSFRRAREVPTDPSDTAADQPVDDHADALADEVLLAHALEQLPEAQRRTLELSYWEGLTQAEVATRLDLPLGTVKSHQRRGLQRLRTVLEVSHDQR